MFEDLDMKAIYGEMLYWLACDYVFGRMTKKDYFRTIDYWHSLAFERPMLPLPNNKKAADI